MTVSELGLQQILLQGFQSARDSAEVSQIRLSTGDQFQTYSEFGAEAVSLLSAESIVSRANAFGRASEIAQTRSGLIGESLGQITESVLAIQDAITRTLATGSAELLTPDIANETQRIISALNVEFGGVFLFGGSNGEVPPVAANSLTELSRLSENGFAFDEGTPISIAIEEGVSVTGGPVASQVATELFSALDDFARITDTLGEFSGNLSTEQLDFAIAFRQRLDGVFDGVSQQVGLNAVSQNVTAEAVTRNQQRQDFAEIVAADIENTDIAAAIAQLNQDQLAIEASAQALAQATQLSLLNFI